jgi:hypothetical protein
VLHGLFTENPQERLPASVGSPVPEPRDTGHGNSQHGWLGTAPVQWTCRWADPGASGSILISQLLLARHPGQSADQKFKGAFAHSGEQRNPLLPEVAPAPTGDGGLHVLEVPLQRAPSLGAAPAAVVLAGLQHSFTYFPQPAADPSGRLELQVEGKRVLVAHRPHPGPRALIYFGGNAEDVSLTRAELAALLPDTALYLLHYRGYGGSEGRPSEAALRADARALYAHVAERHSAVTVVGRSLGTGPAVHLAATRTVQRLVLLVPFDSLLAAAAAVPWWPAGWLRPVSIHQGFRSPSPRIGRLRP